MNTPILVIAFNRPGTLKVLLERLKRLGATNLYFAVDGPRTTRESDVANIAAVRSLINELFSPLAGRCLFQATNLGIRRGPPTAISWFFDQVDEGVILEDDCIPGEDFLPFAAWALETYRNDNQVMVVSGFNRFGSSPWNESHHFIKTAYIWGWASWRRAWRKYDPTFSGWSTKLDQRRLAQWLGAFPVRDFWREAVRMVKSEELITWDVAWCWTVLNLRGLAVMPRVSLIQNIGFGADATNTAGSGPPEARAFIVASPLPAPYSRPKVLAPDLRFQRSLDKAEFWRTKDTIVERLKSVVSSLRAILGPVKRRFLARKS